MDFIRVRIQSIAHCLAERFRYGADRHVGDPVDDTLFVLDGVGGFQIGPLLVRRALRREGIAMRTVLHAWQFGLVGEIWTDLMWLRRNRVMGARLAREILSFRRMHPQARIHLLAFSGGAGIATFACESLKKRPVIETLILAAPALSPQYNLAPALSAVKQAYSLISARDRVILGLGTRLFGTIDRIHCSAAGSVGFRLPPHANADDARGYKRMKEIRWTPALRVDGHSGGHTAWAALRFLQRHLSPLLRHQPSLPVHEVSRMADHQPDDAQ